MSQGNATTFDSPLQAGTTQAFVQIKLMVRTFSSVYQIHVTVLSCGIILIVSEDKIHSSPCWVASSLFGNYYYIIIHSQYSQYKIIMILMDNDGIGL